jgi:hypothetical protein
MPRSRGSDPDQLIHLLNHIHSLGVVSDKDMRRSALRTLLRQGWIYPVWIGSYALTEAGKQARRAGGDRRL